MNYSEWDRPQEDAAESAEAVEKGSMPPWYYPWARLSADERQALIRGLEATFGRAKEGKGGDRRRRGGGGTEN